MGIDNDAIVCWGAELDLSKIDYVDFDDVHKQVEAKGFEIVTFGDTYRDRTAHYMTQPDSKRKQYMWGRIKPFREPTEDEWAAMFELIAELYGVGAVANIKRGMYLGVCIC